MKFEKFPLAEHLLRNLHKIGFFRTTDIQYKAIPSILKGEDVLAIAQTGTGKTAAFAIPIIHLIQVQKTNRKSLGVKCLVMVPTRELAQQIEGVFNKIAEHTKVKAFAVHGGAEHDQQIKKLQEGIDIVIATPGRMFDLIRNGFLSIESLRLLVLDEADRMLELGFLEAVEAIKRKITQRHQTLFFSATINPKIKKLAYSLIQQSAIRIQISPEDPVSKNITHSVMFVEMDDKRFFLKEFLDQNPGGKFIIFVRTRVRAERVAKAMLRVDVETKTLHGEKDQLDRQKVLNDFRSGETQVLIATDVTARGIDIPDVTHVINYDLPEKPENYVHRIGRTGRGFNKGIAVSFCSQEERPLLEEIEDTLGKAITVMTVSRKDYKIIKESQEPLKEEDLKMNFSEIIEQEEQRLKLMKRKKKK